MINLGQLLMAVGLFLILIMVSYASTVIYPNSGVQYLYYGVAMLTFVFVAYLFLMLVIDTMDRLKAQMQMRRSRP